MTRGTWIGLFLIILLIWAAASQRPADIPTDPVKEGVERRAPAPTAPITPKESHARDVRNGARSTLEAALLKGGYDVGVAFIGNNGDNRHLLVLGEFVDRPFVYNMIGVGLQKRLVRDGFTQMTFIKGRNLMGDWIAEYCVSTNVITWGLAKNDCMGQ